VSRRPLDLCRAIRDAGGLSTAEKALMWAIVLHADDGVGCWASQATLATETAMHWRTVMRLLAGLVARGVLVARVRPGRTTTYDVGEIPGPQTPTAPLHSAPPLTPSAVAPLHSMSDAPDTQCRTPLTPSADDLPSELSPQLSHGTANTHTPTVEPDLADVAADLMGIPVTSLSSRDVHAILAAGATCDDLRAIDRWRRESKEYQADLARRDRWPWGTLLDRKRAPERIAAGRRWVRDHPPARAEVAPTPAWTTAPPIDPEEEERAVAEFDRLVGAMA